jgi:ATP-dependent Clp protease protease subunit
MCIMLAESDLPIHVIINSGGGSWYDAMAIYDAIRDCETIVSCEVIGHAMSAAAVIVQACDKRMMHANALMMIHDGSIGTESDIRTFEAQAKNCVYGRKRMYAMLARNSKKKAAFWARKCATDFFMTATEALKFGLIDEILGEE